jgi:hypothetical protein
MDDKHGHRSFSAIEMYNILKNYSGPISVSVVSVTPIWLAWVRFCYKFDEFVPHTQQVNLRIVCRTE